MKSYWSLAAAFSLWAASAIPAGPLHAQAAVPPPAASAPATLQINAAQVGTPISPTFYGLMTEEINHSYDGGLYGELIQNRAFKDDPANPVHWALVQDGGATGTITLDTTQSLNATLDTSLKLTDSGAGGRVGAANDGFWGIPVKPATRYQASFWAKAAPGFTGPVSVDIETSDGATVYASAQVPKITPDWKQYTATLTTTGAATPTAAARFMVSLSKPGTVWLSLVSLFPPTFNNRPNGNRSDLMQKMADMQPAFLRLPGGDGLEGDTIATRFDWKKAIGPLEQRPGHTGAWSYRASDGMGLLEYLEWCEDLKIEPVLAVYAGFSRNGHKNPNPERAEPGPALEPYVQDALDEIEYVTGGPETKWGAERIKDGHPAPFPLRYVEIGNEDFFDKTGSYEGRFAQFFDALKAKYPKLQLIATTPVKSRVPDILDEHFYHRAAQQFGAEAHHYDARPRTGTKIMVGEWATREGTLTPNMLGALGDAAWMAMMERNSDLIVMSCYAPLLTNVNPGAHQWRTDLIGYDALTSYGSPAYYAQIMFRHALGDTLVPSTLVGGNLLFGDVTRDTKTKTLFVKLVNASGDEQTVHVTLTGAVVFPDGTKTVLQASDPTDTNSIAEPTKIVPVTTLVTALFGNGLGWPRFDIPLPPYSITVLQLPGMRDILLRRQSAGNLTPAQAPTLP